MYTVRPERFFDLSKPENQAAAMVKAIELLLQHKLYTSLLILIVCYMDAFAKGDKNSYLQILDNHFPDLTRKTKLSSKRFYEIYRNGMVHRVRPNSGYGFAEDSELKTKYYGIVYLSKTTTGEKEKYLKAINIDRLAKDFLTLARTKSTTKKIVEGIEPARKASPSKTKPR